LAPRRGDADRDHLVALWHRALGAPVEELVLEVDHWIVVTDGGLQQAFRIVSRRRRHDFESGTVHEPRLRILRVVEASAHATAAQRAYDDRHRRGSAVAVAQPRRLV